MLIIDIERARGQIDGQNITHEVADCDGILICSLCQHVGGKMCIACGTVGVGVAEQLARGE